MTTQQDNAVWVPKHAALLTVGARVRVRLSPECPLYPSDPIPFGVPRVDRHEIGHDGITGVIDSIRPALFLPAGFEDLGRLHIYGIYFDTRYGNDVGGRFTATELEVLS